ncbi:uncharacterized protein MONBRDRAFT_8107 [Monosiga brevicollis MX1]|uniref:Uncharacterized protein n=1 Tax=Monosiga brevicollis TaxID=81824 RepID=A9UZ26_MONBE|nr:uncharacterized protein MONBRDRAFT_8107 [Monosiga brevicollis MX1]EDQ89560.1 predicted protein [Monosiga brevicollis MX1]|eukprot:XP_001745589.1 hypothetical protein [Monosiga brevicollis MX1]
MARTESQLQSVAEECRAKGAAKTAVIPCDMSDGQAVQSTVEKFTGEHGFPKVLVNCAGMMAKGHAKEGDPDEWDKMMAINVSAPMRLTRYLSPEMAKSGGGCIINIGSVAAVEPMQSSGAYAASKHALRGWSLSCYQALRHDNIKVVLINPAFVNTELVASVQGVIKGTSRECRSVSQEWNMRRAMADAVRSDVSDTDWPGDALDESARIQQPADTGPRIDWGQFAETAEGVPLPAVRQQFGNDRPDHAESDDEVALDLTSVGASVRQRKGKSGPRKPSQKRDAEARNPIAEVLDHEARRFPRPAQQPRLQYAIKDGEHTPVHCSRPKPRLDTTHASRPTQSVTHSRNGAESPPASTATTSKPMSIAAALVLKRSQPAAPTTEPVIQTSKAPPHKSPALAPAKKTMPIHSMPTPTACPAPTATAIKVSRPDQFEAQPQPPAPAAVSWSSFAFQRDSSSDDDEY